MEIPPDELRRMVFDPASPERDIWYVYTSQHVDAFIC